MKHHPLRNNHTCLNCGNHVENRYCGHCGQENTETRTSFGHLIKHFLEDLTHYEGKFWSTLGYLFSRPAFLTKQYLEGKRSSYLPPIRLYIFASFVTFFLPSLLISPFSEEDTHLSPADLAELAELKSDTTDNFTYHSRLGLVARSKYQNIHELDSVKKAREHSDDPMGYMPYLWNKKAIELRGYESLRLWHFFLETLKKNFPKTLFLFLPLFAFVMMLFHRKSSFYFDHAIFTLHFFSFVLLAFSGYILLSTITDWIYYLSGIGLLDYIRPILFGLLMLWYIYYYFRSHQLLYQERPAISITKGFVVLMINLILFSALFLGLFFLTLISLH